MLQTAAVSDQVLGGIARLLVLQAAGQLGMRVLEEAPNLSHSQCWQEAFTCSWCVPLGCAKAAAAESWQAS